MPKIFNKKKVNNWKVNYVLIIAIVSIILSLFNTFSEHFDKPKMIIRSYTNDIKFNHYFGNIEIYNWLQIKNKGNVSGTISDFYLYIENIDDTSINQIFKAEYGLMENAEIFVPIFDIFLPKNESFLAKIIFKIPKKEKDLDFFLALRSEIDKSQKPINKELKEKIEAICRKGLGLLKEGKYRYCYVLVDGKGKVIKPENYFNIEFKKPDFKYFDIITEGAFKGEFEALEFTKISYRKTSKLILDRLFQNAKNSQQELANIKNE